MKERLSEDWVVVEPLCEEEAPGGNFIYGYHIHAREFLNFARTADHTLMKEYLSNAYKTGEVEDLLSSIVCPQFGRLNHWMKTYFAPFYHILINLDLIGLNIYREYVDKESMKEMLKTHAIHVKPLREKLSSEIVLYNQFLESTILLYNQFLESPILLETHCFYSLKSITDLIFNLIFSYNNSSGLNIDELREVRALIGEALPEEAAEIIYC